MNYKDLLIALHMKFAHIPGAELPWSLVVNISEKQNLIPLQHPRPAESPPGPISPIIINDSPAIPSQLQPPTTMLPAEPYIDFLPT